MAFYDYEKEMKIEPRFKIPSIDPALYDAPQLPAVQPQGFFEKLGALNRGGRVMGQSPTDFAMLMGRIASAVVPPESSYPSGRLGATIAEHAAMKQKQFREDTSPERQLANARAQFALGENASPTEAEYLTSPTPTRLTLQNPAGVAQRLGQFDEAAKGPLSQEYLQTAIGHTKAETGQTLAQTKRLEALTPIEEESMRYQTEQNRLKAEMDKAAFNADLSVRNLQPALTQQQIEASRANIAQGNASLGLRAQGLGLERARLGIDFENMNLNRELKYQGQINGMVGNLQGHLEKIGAQTTKMLEGALPAAHGPILANSGKTIIQNALSFAENARNYEKMDPTGSLRTVTANSIDSGIQYYIQGINSAQDGKTKAQITGQLIMTIDTIRRSQPELARQLESSLFGVGASPIASKGDSRNWFTRHNPWGRDSDAFDPKIFYKMWRQVEQNKKGGK